MKNLGHTIKELRISLGLTQEEFAAKYGVTPLSVSRWENGYAQPREKLLQQMGITYTAPVTGRKEEIRDTVFPVNEGNVLYIPMLSPEMTLCAGDGNDYADSPFQFKGHCPVEDAELKALYSPDGLLAMRVEGDSMEPDICDGDTVVTDRSFDIVNGAEYAVCLDGRYMVKGIVRQGDKPLVLRSFNPAYRDITVTEDNRFRILGRVLRIVPRIKKPKGVL